MSRIDLALKELYSSNYVQFRHHTQKEKIRVKKFNLYLRNHKKIVLDVDKILTCEKYKWICIKTYCSQIFNEPEKFVLYKTGIGWTTEFSEIQEWQVSNERFFQSYMKSLFTNSEIQKCSQCPLVGIHCYCNHCTVEFCLKCFIKLRDCYIPYQDWFKCPNCREINCL